ncbi:ATP-dependent DNA ligase [compost metagenome]
MNGPILWDWVVANSWEGVVSKRLSSPYRAGKEHNDWFKKKTNLQLEVELIGMLMKEGRVSSLVMRKDKAYFGRVSSGLNGKLKEALMALEANYRLEDYWDRLPEGLKYKQIRWFNQPLIGKVSGLEITEGGQLRHPKLLSLGGIVK